MVMVCDSTEQLQRDLTVELAVELGINTMLVSGAQKLTVELRSLSLV